MLHCISQRCCTFLAPANPVFPAVYATPPFCSRPRCLPQQLRRTTSPILLSQRVRAATTWCREKPATPASRWAGGLGMGMRVPAAGCRLPVSGCKPRCSTAAQCGGLGLRPLRGPGCRLIGALLHHIQWMLSPFPLATSTPCPSRPPWQAVRKVVAQAVNDVTAVTQALRQLPAVEKMGAHPELADVLLKFQHTACLLERALMVGCWHAWLCCPQNWLLRAMSVQDEGEGGLTCCPADGGVCDAQHYGGGAAAPGALHAADQDQVCGAGRAGATHSGADGGIAWSGVLQAQVGEACDGGVCCSWAEGPGQFVLPASLSARYRMLLPTTGAAGGAGRAASQRAQHCAPALPHAGPCGGAVQQGPGAGHWGQPNAAAARASQFWAATTARLVLLTHLLNFCLLPLTFPTSAVPVPSATQPWHSATSPCCRWSRCWPLVRCVVSSCCACWLTPRPSPAVPTVSEDCSQPPASCAVAQRMLRDKEVFARPREARAHLQPANHRSRSPPLVLPALAPPPVQ